jgi:16S rRNA (guanine527-N7)-methyltransferase
MKGKKPCDEIMALSNTNSWKVSKIEQLQVPELEAQRCLVWLQRNEDE